MKIYTIAPRFAAMLVAVLAFAATTNAQTRLQSLDEGQAEQIERELASFNNSSSFDVGQGTPGNDDSNVNVDGNTETLTDFYIDYNMDFGTHVLNVDVRGVSPRFVHGISMTDRSGNAVQSPIVRFGNRFEIGVEDLRPTVYILRVHTSQGTSYERIDLR